MRSGSSFGLGDGDDELQLWAFEAISAWLRRLGDDDELKQLSYVNEKLPQDTWLVLAEVQEAEHDPQCGEDKEDGWGEFDGEFFDHKVADMVKLLKVGHKF
ncbi:hypothetical protein YC2023_028700 [Brassica napus]